MDDLGCIDIDIHGRCSPGRLEQEIGGLALRQHGVVARRQLVALGLGRGAVDHRVSVGRLLVLYAGVYAVGHRALTADGHRMAGVLACGPGARLSHRDAAALWNLRDNARAAIDVTTPRRGLRGHPGITLHRVRCIDPRDVTVKDGIPVTTVARTLLDLAEVVPFRQLERAFEAAERMRVLDVNAIEQLVERTRGRRGLKPLGALLADRRDDVAPTRSDLERDFLDLLHDHGLPPPQVNVKVGGYEVDACWPEHRLVVELDSREFHLTPAAFERDRVRDAALVLAGCRVIRITYRRLRREPARIAATIRALIATT